MAQSTAVNNAVQQGSKFVATLHLVIPLLTLIITASCTLSLSACSVPTLRGDTTQVVRSERLVDDSPQYPSRYLFGGTSHAFGFASCSLEYMLRV